MKCYKQLSITGLVSVVLLGTIDSRVVDYNLLKPKFKIIWLIDAEKTFPIDITDALCEPR